MKKITTTSMHERTSLRAYYAWLNGSTAGAEVDWLAAEQIEQAYAERRAAAARKAAETRKAKIVSAAPAIAAAAKRRPSIRFPTTH